MIIAHAPTLSGRGAGAAASVSIGKFTPRVIPATRTCDLCADLPRRMRP